jgi:exonuclease III
MPITSHLNFLAAHININSYRYKFDEIKELLSDKIVDIFFVAESKLDATLFPTDVFRKNESEKDGKRSLQR